MDGKFCFTKIFSIITLIIFSITCIYMYRVGPRTSLLPVPYGFNLHDKAIYVVIPKLKRH